MVGETAVRIQKLASGDIGSQRLEHLAGIKAACAVAGMAGIPLVEALARPRTFDQRALGRRGRIHNLQGRFQALPGATVPARILLIDDVCTTGSTMNAACDALRAAGAVELHCLVFARV